MWAALTAYQPQADAAGHGETWAQMCSEKTHAAAKAANVAVAADYAAYAAYAASRAAYAASRAAYAAEAATWVQKAINGIKKITIPAQPAYTKEDIDRAFSAGIAEGKKW